MHILNEHSLALLFFIYINMNIENRGGSENLYLIHVYNVSAGNVSEDSEEDSSIQQESGSFYNENSSFSQNSQQYQVHSNLDYRLSVKFCTKVD